MTGMDLIMLYCNIRQAPQSAADELIELFKMKEYVHHAVGTYSAGMTKKLSLVLAFLGNTPLIVLDEPLITLDPDALSTVCNFILQKHNHNGTTFLLSSHQELDTTLLLSGRELTVKNRSVF
jgi:ABC-2 type transport system ATP-binding protein